MLHGKLKGVLAAVALLMGLVACNEDPAPEPDAIASNPYSVSDSCPMPDSAGVWLRDSVQHAAFFSDSLGVCTPDPVDWQRNTVVGIPSTTTACEVQYTRRLDRLNDTLYRYRVTVQPIGLCSTQWTDPNWRLIPRLAANDSLFFEVFYLPVE